ncbi:hypothetical protein CNY89_27605, partial [Amaricoccus sp. HAR-UPW-R2A-40]
CWWWSPPTWAPISSAGSAAAPGSGRRSARARPGLVYMALSMSFLTMLRDADGRGFPMVVWLVLVVVAADVGAYFVGRICGGPRLWPAVSPGKTW